LGRRRQRPATDARGDSRVKSIDSGFQTALNADVTNLARLWELLRSNGTEYRFTDHDRDITHDGNTFSADPGIRISAIRSVTGGGTQNATIEIACATGFITMDQVRRGGLRGATFNVYLVNWKTPTQPSVNLFRGRVSTSRVTDRGKAECEVRGLLGGAQKVLGEIYQQQCRADLGDERCTFDRDSTSDTFTVTAVASNGMSFTTDVVVAASLLGVRRGRVDDRRQRQRLGGHPLQRQRGRRLATTADGLRHPGRRHRHAAAGLRQEPQHVHHEVQQPLELPGRA
jgi:uncharacterized phage protein (TIGR02218 family)